MDRGRGRGRGRHGGYAGRSRGRGSSWVRGDGTDNYSNRNNSMAWVRPKDSASIKNSTNKVSAASAMPAVAAAQAQSTVPVPSGPPPPSRNNSANSGPILRGPRDHGGRFSGRFPGRNCSGRGRGMTHRENRPIDPIQHHNTWKRTEEKHEKCALQKNEKAKATKGGAGGQFDGASGKSRSVSRSKNHDDNGHRKQEAIDSNSINSLEGELDDHSELIPNDKADDTKSKEVDVEQPSTIVDNESREGMKVQISESGAATRKHASTSTTAAVPDANSLQRPRHHEQQQQQGEMVHKGSNKLVLSTKITQSSESTMSRHHTGQNVHRGGGHKRTSSPHNIPAVKRIKINAIETTGGAKVGDDETNITSNTKGKNISVASTTSNNETLTGLTDFSYASHGGRGGRSRPTRGGRGRHQPNMGLVRVNSDATPICPTFLRGVRCRNELCRNRHDVPRESARPVCSFFQRHGQCLKGNDCPFRHVKVNSRATLCPGFNLLGYCDDTKCVMKHVSANKSMKTSRTYHKANS